MREGHLTALDTLEAALARAEARSPLNAITVRHFELARDDYPNPSVIDNRIAHLRKKLKK